MKPKKGDLVEIFWLDITESSTGDPDEAKLSERSSVGIYLGKVRQRGKTCIVTTTTREGWDEQKIGFQSGYCIYPEGAIYKIRVIEPKNGEES